MQIYIIALKILVIHGIIENDCCANVNEMFARVSSSACFSFETALWFKLWFSILLLFQCYAKLT